MNYNIIGEPFPAVVCTLNADESMITERGSMCWMSPNMKMETTSNGGIGKVFGRMFSGESMFQNRYTAVGGAGTIAFASSFPGSVRCFDITPNNPLIVQKSGFLASESTVELSVHFQKRFGAGLFGGEGFIMQKLSGFGKAFIEIDGHAVEYDLRPGQSIVVEHRLSCRNECDLHNGYSNRPRSQKCALRRRRLFQHRCDGTGQGSASNHAH